MKKGLYIFFLLFGLCVSAANAQVYFNKTYSPYIGGIGQGLMPNNDIILVGISETSSKHGIVVNRFNKCGDLIWSKNISNNDYNLIPVDMQLDKNLNIIIAGYFGKDSISAERKIFLMRLSPNGSVDYFKAIKTVTNDIAYSMKINKRNEVLLYFKTNTGQVGPHSENTIAKFTANGQLIWMKQYGFTGFWGKMCTTSDGGAIITNNRSVIKINDKGIVQWTKEFQNGFNSTALFEVPNGVVILRDSGSQRKVTYVVLIGRNGDLKWNSQIIDNYGWVTGILRKNGHLLFEGKLSHPDLGVPSFIRNASIEIDTSNGTILKTLVQKEEAVLSQGQFILNMNETSKGEIIASGKEILSATGSTFISKINNQLRRVSCQDTLLKLNYPRDTGKLVSSKNSWVAQKVNFPIIEPSVNLDTFKMGYAWTVCQYSPTFSIFIGKDTILCPGNKLVLSDTNALFDHYQWSNGATTPPTTVDSAGIYWLKAWNDCDTTIFSDSIQIAYHPLPSINLGNDTAICVGDSILLATKSDTTYWSTGDTSKSIWVKKVGTYWAEVPTICGFLRDSITIKQYPRLSLNLGNDTVLCHNQQLTLFADSNASHSLWSTGDTSSQLTIDSAGTYWVRIWNACDTLSDTVNVSFYPKTNFKSSITPNPAFIMDSIHFYLLTPSKTSSLLWKFDDGTQSTHNNPWHIYEKAGSYQPNINLIDSFGCPSDSTFQLLIQNIPIQIPNVFTPNGDGINDVFEMNGTGIKIQQISIYDRWGQLTYHSNNTFWDGKTSKGYKAETATYFYVIKYQAADAKSKTIKGAVLLIR